MSIFESDRVCASCDWVVLGSIDVQSQVGWSEKRVAGQITVKTPVSDVGRSTVRVIAVGTSEDACLTSG